MDFDLTALSPESFELLVGALLSEMGYRNVSQTHPGAFENGVDWAAVRDDGARVVAQAKLVRTPLTSPAVAMSMVSALQRGRELFSAAESILFLSQELAPPIKDELTRSVAGLRIIDGPELQSMLARYSDIAKAYAAVTQANAPLTNLIRRSGAEPTTVSAQSNDLIQRLREVPAGQEGWREYEDICVDILSFTLMPPLRTPKLQTRSDDGLDRRDAIFPIGTGFPFWDGIKSHLGSWMVVAEFKNYSGPIAQTEVESIQQYLLPKARRTFGILCSRKEPSESAQKARRRAWMISDNLIVFLSDGDLIQMARYRADGEDPSVLIESQLHDFFLGLSP